MKHVFKFLIMILIGVIILFSCLYFFITSEYFFQNFAIPELATITKGKIKAGKIIFSPLSSDIKIEDVQITPQENLSFKIGRADISFDPLDLLYKKITISSLILKDIHIRYEETIDTDKVLKENTGFFNTNVTVNNSDLGNFDHYNPIEKYKINLKDISLENININYVIKSLNKKHKTLISVNDINLSIPKIKTGTVTLAKCSGNFSFSPYQENKPLTGRLLSKIHLDLSDRNIVTLLKSNSIISYNSLNNTIIDLIYNNINEGSIQLKISDLPLQPLLTLTNKKEKRNFNSLLSNFSLDFKNIFEKTKFNGSIQASFKNCSLPIFLNNFDIFKPFFIPITKLTEIPLKNSVLNNSQRLVKAVDYANALKDGAATLYFDNINIEAQINSNSASISKAVFDAKKSPINLFKISGNIKHNGDIKLMSSINYNGIIIPMLINGSIFEPKINFDNLTKDLIKQNTEVFTKSKPIKTKEEITKIAEDTEKQINN